MKKINLEEILKKHSNITIDDQEDVLIAMKDAIKQALELAAENATTVEVEWALGVDVTVDKDSILNTINQIE